MVLRKHQQEMKNIIAEIQSGTPIKYIYVDVTPGGGKSLLPVLLAELLPGYADRMCWVTPRTSLQYQGEREFVNWQSPHRLRVAANESDLCRGLAGYLTTYQGIAANPQCHYDEFRNHKYILVLDEPHHVESGSSWYQALYPLIHAAVLVVYMSGTFSRGDNQPIGFIPYKDGRVNICNNADSRVIKYTRKDALKEGAILPIYFRKIDGEASWFDKEGEFVEAATLEDGGESLFTALRTEYADHILTTCFRDWQEHKKVFPCAKMLIVAPNIELAGQYRKFLIRSTQTDVLIATSADTPEARSNINRLKGIEKPEIDSLSTVGMAYEGLSVPQITHIVCLTSYRTVPWLEQCFARANRLHPGKLYGVIYLPADRKMAEAIRAIELEQESVLSEPREQDHNDSDEKEESGEKLTITPLSSQAHFITELQFEMEKIDPVQKMTPSDVEKILKDQIRGRIKIYLDKQRPGNQMAMKRLIYLKIKQLVPKQIDQMASEELVKVWGLTIEICPV